MSARTRSPEPALRYVRARTKWLDLDRTVLRDRHPYPRGFAVAAFLAHPSLKNPCVCVLYKSRPCDLPGTPYLRLRCKNHDMRQRSFAIKRCQYFFFEQCDEVGTTCSWEQPSVHFRFSDRFFSHAVRHATWMSELYC